MRQRLRGAWKEFVSWHRGLPDPPGKPQLTWALARRALRESNALYFAGLRTFYRSLFGDWRTSVAQQQKREDEAERERASDAAAKALAEGARVAAADGPAAVRRWLAPRLALFSAALVEFGRGFREGKNAPEVKLDLTRLFKADTDKSAKTEATKIEKQ